MSRPVASPGSSPWWPAATTCTSTPSARRRSPTTPPGARRHLPDRLAHQADHRGRHHVAGRGGPPSPRRADRRARCRSWPTAGCCASIDAELDDTVPARRPITLEDLLSFRFGFGSVMAPPGSYPIQRAEADAGAPEHRRSAVAPGGPRCRQLDRRARLAAAHVPAGRAVALQHLGPGARRPPGAGVRPGPGVGAPGAHLRAARDDRHRVHRARRARWSRLTTAYQPDPRDRRAVGARRSRRQLVEHADAVPGCAAAGSSPPSTTTGRSSRWCWRAAPERRGRILSPETVALMTTDRLTRVATGRLRAVPRRARRMGARPGGARDRLVGPAPPVRHRLGRRHRHHVALQPAQRRHRDPVHAARGHVARAIRR